MCICSCINAQHTHLNSSGGRLFGPFIITIIIILLHCARSHRLYFYAPLLPPCKSLCDNRLRTRGCEKSENNVADSISADKYFGRII